MKHVLWVMGLVTLAPTIYFFVEYLNHASGTGRSSLLKAGGFFVVSLIFWAVFFFKRFKEQGDQEISITKF